MIITLSWIPFLVGSPIPCEEPECPLNVRLISDCSGLEFPSPISMVSSAGSVAGCDSWRDLAYHLCSSSYPVHHPLQVGFLMLLTFYRLIVMIYKWSSLDANDRGLSRQGMELFTLPNSQHKKTKRAGRHMIINCSMTGEHTISDR